MEGILGMFNSSKDKDRENVSETGIQLDKILSELEVIKSSIARLADCVNDGKAKLSDIEKRLTEMTGDVAVKVTPVNTVSYSSRRVTDVVNEPVSSCILVTPIKRSAGIELIKRSADESFKAQFELNASSRVLSFNSRCLEFCMIDLEARLLPFVDAEIAVKDQTPTNIEQIQTGIAENVNGTWFCKVKPKLRIV